MQTKDLDCLGSPNKYHRMEKGILNNMHLSSDIYGAIKFDVKVSAGLTAVFLHTCTLFVPMS